MNSLTTSRFQLFQGGVIFPLLFSCYTDKLLTQLQQSGLGCHFVFSYAGAFGYAHDIALLAPSLQCLKKMISICENFASSYSITFNPKKSKLLCYNAELTSNAPQVYLNGEKIPIVDSDKHLGNFISTNIADRNITESVCDFRVCDSSTPYSFHRTYSMHMYIMGASYGS